MLRISGGTASQIALLIHGEIFCRGIAQAKEKRLNNSGTLPAATRTDDRAGSSDSPSKGSSLSSIRSPSRTSNLSPVKSGTLQSKGGSGHLLMKDGKSGGSFISSQGKGGSKALVRAEGWEGESEESSDSEAPSSRGQPATPPSRVAVASRRNVGKRQPIHDSPEVEEARAKLKVLSVRPPKTESNPLGLCSSVCGGPARAVRGSRPEMGTGEASVAASRWETKHTLVRAYLRGRMSVCALVFMFACVHACVCACVHGWMDEWMDG
jgi:hypothetical protein